MEEVDVSPRGLARHATIGKMRVSMTNTNASPLVSVLMPAYNHAPYVRVAVESVLGQTHGNLELIVIDDASLDETWAELQSIKDDRLRLTRHENNQGAHATLNEAMGMAQGDYIAILNSDDIYSPKRLERLLEAANEAGSAELFMYSDVDFIEATGASASEEGRAMDYRALLAVCATLEPLNWFLAGNPAISSSNFFFSRALAKKVGGFAPLRYTHDWDWALRACRQAVPVWLHEPLLAYRVHPGNTLSEDDAWRHIHENSHIQAKALLARPSSADPETETFAACQALLRNMSFHPLALLVYVLYGQAGVADGRLEELTVGDQETWFLKNLAWATGCPEDLFRSVRQLAEFKHVIASQAALLQERWGAIRDMSGVIIERDRTIEAQGQLLADRLNAIEQMNGMIEERDRCVTAQDAMIQERWQTMQEMSEEITDLRSDRLVKLALRVRKAMRWLRSDSNL